MKVVEYLLSELYVDPNCTTEKGSTPITLTRDTHIRELLLQYGAVLPEVSSISEVASVSTQRRGRLHTMPHFCVNLLREVNY